MPVQDDTDHGPLVGFQTGQTPRPPARNVPKPLKLDRGRSSHSALPYTPLGEIFIQSCQLFLKLPCLHIQGFSTCPWI